jgi:photosystem II stability/assembly factor-like uncharacterized protein
MKPLLVALSVLVAVPLSAAWTSHGPIGGQVTALAVAATDRRVIYAAAPDGLFRTGDAGATWRNVSGPIDAPDAVVVSGADPNIVVAAGANGVFRSDDAGVTWQLGAGLPKTVDTGDLLADPRDPNVVYFGNGCYTSPEVSPPGVYKSTDGGRSFASTTSNLPLAQQCAEHLTLDPAVPDRLFLFFNYYDEVQGTLRSDDGGASWTRVDRAPTQSIVLSPKDGERRFGIDKYGVLTSNDGASWSPVLMQGVNSTLTRLTIDPNVPRLFLGTTAGAYRSGNGGQSWLPLEGAGRDRINALDFDPAGGALTIGTNVGLFRSSGFPWNDWTDLHLGDDALTIDQVAADPTNGDVYAVVQSHLFRSTDHGASWQLAAPPLPGTFRLWNVVAGAAHDLYAFTQHDATMTMLKLRADRTEWDALSFKAVDDVVADPSVPGTVYVVNGVVTRTRDSGVTWAPVQTPSGFYILQLAVDAGDPNLLLAFGTNGSSETVFKSTDGGRTWTTIPVPPHLYFDSLVATAHPGDFFLAGLTDSGPALMRSVDGGETWSVLPKQPPAFAPPSGAPRNVFAVDRRDANVIYLAAFAGVMRSVDGGRSWQSIDGGLPAHASTLAIDAANVLHAGTNSRGVWELDGPPRRRAAGR